MTSQLALPACVLPGCRTPVAAWGQPCRGCREAFGDLLHHNPVGASLTAEQIHNRDSHTRAILYARHMARKSDGCAR